VRVDLAEAHRHGIDAQLQLLFEVGDLLFLLSEQGAELDRVAQHHALMATAAKLQADRKSTAKEEDHQGREGS
jgi:hypothetical protein